MTRILVNISSVPSPTSLHFLTGTSDPYVTFDFDGFKEWRTSIQKKVTGQAVCIGSA